MKSKLTGLMQSIQPVTVEQAVKLLADEAERRGATADDDGFIVRELVLENGLGFNAWLSICCELDGRHGKLNPKAFYAAIRRLKCSR
jgi:hypothetical protein